MSTGLCLDSQAEMTEWSQMNSLQGFSNEYFKDNRNSKNLGFILPNSF